MSVAWGQFRPGIANADYGSPIKQMMRQTLVFHPGTIHEAHLIHFPEPILAPELSVCGGCHNFSLISANCPVSEIACILLRSKWAVGKAVRAGLAGGSGASRTILPCCRSGSPAWYHMPTPLRRCARPSGRHGGKGTPGLGPCVAPSLAPVQRRRAPPVRQSSYVDRHGPLLQPGRRTR